MNFRFVSSFVTSEITAITEGAPCKWEIGNAFVSEVETGRHRKGTPCAVPDTLCVRKRRQGTDVHLGLDGLSCQNATLVFLLNCEVVCGHFDLLI